MKWEYKGPVYLKPACRGLDLIVNGESYDINDFVPHGDYIATIVLIGHEESSDSQHTERVVRDDELA